MRAKPLCHACGVPPPLIRGGFAAVKFYRNTVCYCETKSLCQWLPFQERLPRPGEVARKCRKGNGCRADARLRGWTKDAFRVSGITQVLLCTTSPSSSLRSMPPPLVGEALAFRRVFQQNQISFIENETSLPRAPLPGKTPPAGEVARKCRKGNGWRADARLRGWTKDAFRVSGITQVLLCTTSPSRLRRATSPSRGGFGIP